MGVQVLATTSVIVENSPSENLLLLEQQHQPLDHLQQAVGRASSPSFVNATSNPSQQPQWRPDESSDTCNCCGREFSYWMRRRHHCRACGELVCAECSPFWDLLPDLGYKTRVRVCKDCKDVNTGESNSGYTSCSDGAMSSCAGSPISSWGEGSIEMDAELLNEAIDVIALHSSDKNTRLWYDYFVQSEAVNWLMDAEVVKTRANGAMLFTRLIEDGYISKKRGTTKSLLGSKRSVFYVLNDLISSENRRSSYYDNGMHSETQRCCNCSRSYLENLTSTPGFCSIDCQTNALIKRSDSARARQLL